MNSARRLSPDEYSKLLISMIETPPVRTLDIGEVLGCVSAEPVYAACDIPRFANSAVDGFAVAAETLDLLEHGSVRLEVVASVEAGASPGLVLEPSAAVQVMTGAPVPVGAAAVIPVEATSGFVRPGETVEIYEQTPRKPNIRPQGEDIHEAEQFLATNQVIEARHLAGLAAFGMSTLRVRSPLRVLVISTGSELVQPGFGLRPGLIHDSNGPMIAAFLQRIGCTVEAVLVVPDDPGKVRETVARYRPSVDLVITSGGISAGTSEAIRLAFGSQLRFASIAMKPGAPQAFGMVDGVPLVGLPGNPVAAFVSLEVLFKPALQAVMGVARRSISTSVANVEQFVSDSVSWRFVLTSRSGDNTFFPVRPGRSNSVVALANADHLVCVPPSQQRLSGARLTAQALEMA